MNAMTLFNEKLPESLQQHPQKARALDAIYLFRVTGEGGGTWTVDLKANPPSVCRGESGTPGCTIELAAQDLEALTGNLALAMQLFFQGKIKISGDPLLATRLQSLFALA